MKTMKKLLAAMLAIAMLLTCAAFNPLTATAEGAATDSSETTRYCGNDDYPAKSLGGNYSGMPLNIDKKSLMIQQRLHRAAVRRFWHMPATSTRRTAATCPMRHG